MCHNNEYNLWKCSSSFQKKSGKLTNFNVNKPNDTINFNDLFSRINHFCTSLLIAYTFCQETDNSRLVFMFACSQLNSVDAMMTQKANSWNGFPVAVLLFAYTIQIESIKVARLSIYSLLYSKRQASYFPVKCLILICPIQLFFISFHFINSSQFSGKLERNDNKEIAIQIDCQQLTISSVNVC